MISRSTEGYGLAAVMAVYRVRRAGLAPVDAWNEATAWVFAHSASQQEKGCPRGTFLGLCAAGMVEGVAAGGELGKNGRYAVEAVTLLRSGAAPDPRGLWRQVMSSLGESTEKKYNRQMDVVLALWSVGLVGKG